MFCTSMELPFDWVSANVYILSDLHIGDRHTDMNNVYDRIQRILDDPNGLCILNGDIMNTALRQGVSDVYGEQLSPIEQMVACKELLRPIANKVIAATSGNHENRIYKQVGIDSMAAVCEDLGILDRYNPDGVLTFLSIGQKSAKEAKSKKPAHYIYSIYNTHGSGGGRKEGAKMIRLADMNSIVDADIFVHSHTHMPAVFKEKFIRVDTQHHSCCEVDKLFINDGSSLGYGGYGQQYEYKPSSNASPVIFLSGTTKYCSGTV